MKTALFLHMGPGLNAVTESMLLGSRNPAVDYWDQPSVTGENAFSDLVEAAITKAKALAAASGKPIELIAHSFGGHLAREIIDKTPETVASLTLLSTGHDLVASFHTLLRKLEKDSETPAELLLKMTEYLRENPGARLATFWLEVGMIVKDQTFGRPYWPTKELFQNFLAVFAKAPPLSFPTFKAVVNSFLRKRDFIPKRMQWKGPVSLILGDCDPLIQVSETVMYWQTLFPQLTKTIRKNSGHYAHIEDVLRKI